MYLKIIALFSIKVDIISEMGILYHKSYGMYIHSTLILQKNYCLNSNKKEHITTLIIIYKKDINKEIIKYGDKMTI